ncbi:MAG: hypothetical protein KJ626_00320 [Verrucomicrobia bacterium]|nr:hypothetical protein [Verrucomicrobiota bacterium]
MKKRTLGFAVLTALVLSSISLTFIGCEGDSGDSAIRQVAIIVAGFYSNPNGDIVQQNTGSPISTMNLLQTGDHLEGIDNNGIIFKGTIGQADSTSASITLTGVTTAGNKGTIAGTISKGSAESTDAELQGTWVEPSLFSTVYGQASVPSSPSNSVNVSISPSSASLTNNGATVAFSASGGSGSYAWSVDNGNGSLSSSSGTSVTYTRSAAGDNGVNVTSGGDSASVTVFQP